MKLDFPPIVFILSGFGIILAGFYISVFLPMKIYNVTNNAAPAIAVMIFGWIFALGGLIVILLGGNKFLKLTNSDLESAS
jgi:Na+-transporting NADH:ubiquinone oxidoreductase subunit NqrB